MKRKTVDLIQEHGSFNNEQGKTVCYNAYFVRVGRSLIPLKVNMRYKALLDYLMENEKEEPSDYTDYDHV